VECNEPEFLDPVAGIEERFGCAHPPAAFYTRYPTNDEDDLLDGVIVFRYSIEFDFWQYVGLLYLLFHEYTAHVHCTDHENEMFNDGWMMWVANDHLVRRVSRPLALPSVSRWQAYVFEEHLAHRLTPMTRRALHMSTRVWHWLLLELNDEGERILAQLTFDLAAFEPDESRPPSWPTMFINTLYRELNRNPGRLLKVLRAKPPIQSLLDGLASS
jgi:hypothetical protein